MGDIIGEKTNHTLWSFSIAMTIAIEIVSCPMKNRDVPGCFVSLPCITNQLIHHKASKQNIYKEKQLQFFLDQDKLNSRNLQNTLEHHHFSWEKYGKLTISINVSARLGVKKNCPSSCNVAQQLGAGAHGWNETFWSTAGFRKVRRTCVAEVDDEAMGNHGYC